MSQKTDAPTTQEARGPGISACIIVRNEEQMLPECLASIRPWVEQICIIDTGSTDRTVAIAESFGATVGRFTWCDDFSAARNASLALARFPWILCIDADEALDQTTGQALRRAIAEPEAQAQLCFVDSQIAGGQVSSIAVPRLFRNRPDIRFSRPVHEDITDSLFALGLKTINHSGVRLLHKGYQPEIVASRDKVGRNLAILRQRVRDVPGDIYSTWKLAASLSQPEQAAERHQAFHAAVALSEGLSAEARSEYPFLPLVYAGLGQSLGERGALAEGLRAVDQGLGHFDGNVDLIFRRGDLLRRSGDSDQAARCLRQCVGAERASIFYSGDAAARGVLPAVGLGLLALEAGNLDGAVSMVSLALRFDATNLDARCLKVRTLVVQGQIPQAMTELEGLMKLAPTAPPVQLLGGELAWLQGDHELAMDLWRGAQGPTDAGNDARAQLAIAELAYGSRTAAILHLPDLVARDVPSAACRAILTLLCGADLQIDAAFRKEALLRHITFWLREIAGAGRREILQSFMEGARQADDRLPGVAALVTA